MKPPGFVEPEPEFFARMGRLVTETHALLKAAGAFETGAKEHAANLREIVAWMKRKGPLTQGEKAFKELTTGDMHMLERMNAWAMGVDLKPPRDKKDVRKFFARVLDEFTKLADRIEKRGLPDDPKLRRHIKRSGIQLEPLWRRLAELCTKLEALAHKQLRNVRFNDAENRFVKGYGAALAGIMLYGGNSYLTPNDDAPRVIDVFSNPNVRRVLEVGIGRARALYVLYPVAGGEVLCRGAVMPYYEFTHSARLTDKAWRARLDSRGRPAIPVWIAPIVSGGKLSVPKLKADH